MKITTFRVIKAMHRPKPTHWCAAAQILTPHSASAQLLTYVIPHFIRVLKLIRAIACNNYCAVAHRLICGFACLIYPQCANGMA